MTIRLASIAIAAAGALALGAAACGSSSSPSGAVAGQSTCAPLSNKGTCYEPGEYCRTSDAGMTGVAGNGEAIVCTDNNGLRWEPRSSTPPASTQAAQTQPPAPSPGAITQTPTQPAAASTPSMAPADLIRYFNGEAGGVAMLHAVIDENQGNVLAIDPTGWLIVHSNQVNGVGPVSFNPANVSCTVSVSDLGGSIGPLGRIALHDGSGGWLLAFDLSGSGAVELSVPPESEPAGWQGIPRDSPCDVVDGGKLALGSP
jgi:hypothetical protein